MANLVFWTRKRGHEKREMRSVRRTPSTKKMLLTKRRKFVLVSLILSVGLFVIQSISVESRYVAIFLLAFFSYAMSAWALVKDLRGVAWVSALVLPTLYPVAVALFYFLLPQAAWTRVVVIVMFAISMYALLLTSNIFAVASIRTIQLLRAARTVGFLISILTAAFLYYVVFSFRLPYYINMLMSVLIAFPIFLSGVWGYVLEEKLGKREFSYTFVGSVVMTETVMALSFWLTDAAMASILLSMMVYVTLGIFQHKLEKRLFARTAQEYLGFAAIVFAVVVISILSRWAT